MPEESPIAVVAPTFAEAAPFVRRLQGIQGPIRLGTASAVTGRLGDHVLVAGWTGGGVGAAHQGLQELLDHFEPQRLVVIGVAAGVTSALNTGDCVVARRIRDAEGDAPEPDRQWGLRATLLGAHPGLVYTQSTLLTTSREKLELGRRLGVQLAGTSDLESTAYARLAGSRGLPFTVVRAIIDPADESLPFDGNHLLRPGGGTSTAQVLRYGTLRPWVIPSIWRLRGRLRKCSEKLAAMAEWLVAKPARWKVSP